MTRSTKKRIAPKFREAAESGEIHIQDYFCTGSPTASEYEGCAGDTILCVNCGARIVHVFMSEIGPLGGDCAATLTGDPYTRSAIRKQLPKMLLKMANGRASKLWISKSNSDYFIWIQVRGTGYIRDYDGACLNAREEIIGIAKDINTAKMLASYAAEQTQLDYPGYYMDVEI